MPLLLSFAHSAAMVERVITNRTRRRKWEVQTVRQNQPPPPHTDNCSISLSICLPIDETPGRQTGRQAGNCFEWMPAQNQIQRMGTRMQKGCRKKGKLFAFLAPSVPVKASKQAREQATHNGHREDQRKLQLFFLFPQLSAHGSRHLSSIQAPSPFCTASSMEVCGSVWKWGCKHRHN